MNYSAIMSRADFVALAGVVAIWQGSIQQDCGRLNLPTNCTKPMPNITIKYGRRDCPTSPMTTVDLVFPNPHGNLTHVLEFFGTGMNMRVREVVALIGAHTLGSANVQHSGFVGSWAPPTDRFDNSFYRALNNSNNMWFQRVVNHTDSVVYPDVRYQWNNRPSSGQQLLFMLNTDMVHNCVQEVNSFVIFSVF